MQLGLPIGVLSMVVATFACIAYMNAATSTFQRPANYRAAVMRVLDERHVDYRDVVVVDGCAPTYEFCHTYAGSVQVLTTTMLPGRIDCRERWISCTLTVPELGINSDPMDDIVDWLLARWEDLYGQFMLELSRRFN